MACATEINLMLIPVKVLTLSLCLANNYLKVQRFLNLAKEKNCLFPSERRVRFFSDNAVGNCFSKQQVN